MTTIARTTIAPASTTGIPSLLHRLRASLSERSRIARIRRELSALSNRDLEDIGIARRDIPAIANGTYIPRSAG